MTPRQLLGKARVHTFEYVPYLASYIYALREQEKPGIGTAGVDDAGNLYWDPEFIKQIDTGQCAYLVAHEALHLIFQHHQRSREIIGQNPEEWQRFAMNVAGDLVIEQTLHMMRHLRPEGAMYLGCEIPSWGITLDFPENKSMQEYYRLILEKLKGNKQQQQQGGNNAAGDTEGSDDNGNQSGETGGDSPPSSDGADGGGEDSAEDGTDADGSEASPVGGAGSPSAGQGKAPQKPGAPGTGGSCADGQPRPYEVDSDGTWETYGEDMAAAAAEEAIAQFEKSNPDSVPGSIKQAIKQKLRPQPDPFDQLRSAVCSSVASPVGGRDYSRRRRSRKQPPGDDQPLLHGRITVQPHAVVIVDTSSSMMTRDTQEKALSVVAQGLRKLSRVKVYCADTHVQSSATVTNTERFEWHGGGGTDMAAALMQVDKDDRPDSIILITDAETHWSKQTPRARVVVAYTGERNSKWHRAIPKSFRTVPLTQEA
jgi:predicted metal-dependent peptidase